MGEDLEIPVGSAPVDAVGGRLDRPDDDPGRCAVLLACGAGAGRDSAFLCAIYGVQGNLQHAEYLDHYYAVLGRDPKAFWRAATAASKAAQFLRESTEAEAQAA